ncbi:MAG: CHAT domain-containing protein [Aureispira sp.]|nr:CHAT domain-containing protein [Aureispira sp.]
MKTLLTLSLTLLSIISYSQSIQEDTVLAKQYKSEANSLLGEGKTQEAVVIAKKAVDLYKQHQLWDQYFQLQLSLHDITTDINSMDDAALKAADQATDKLLRDSRLNLGDNSVMEAKILARKGALFMYFDHLKSKEYYDRAVKTLTTYHPEEKANLIWMLGNLCIVSGFTGESEEAIQHAERQLSLAKEVYGDKSTTVASAYGLLASNYQDMKEYNKALSYLEKNLQINLAQGNESYDIAQTYLSLGQLHIALGKYEDALEAFEKALAIAKKVKQPVWGVPWIMDNISQLYEAWGKYDKALEYSKKTDKAYQDLFGGTGRKPDVVGNIKERLGNCMSELGDQEGARTYMHEALLKFEQAHGGKNHPDLADLFNKMAKTYVRDGDFKRAMTYYHKSISTNNSEFSGNTIDFESSEVIPNIDFMDYDAALEALTGWKAALDSSYNKTLDAKDLEVSLKISHTVANLVDQTTKRVTNSKDKLALIQEAHYQYEKGIETAYQLFQKNQDPELVKQAFTFAERNKSLLLLDVLQTNKALTFGDVPPELLQEEETLEEEIAKLNKKQLDPILRRDSIKLAKVKDELFDKKRKMEALLKKIEDNYPKYYHLKHMDKLATTEVVQERLLDNSTCLLEYFVGEKAIYLFAITKEKAFLYKTPINNNYTDILEGLLKNISNVQYVHKNPEKAYSTFITHAHQLYQLLMGKVLDQQKDIKHLIIVPDGLLGHLPFEVLLQEAGQEGTINYTTLKYLLKEYNISYSYSSTLLLENKENQHTIPNTDLLSMAATYGGDPQMANATRSPEQKQLRSVLSDLPAARTEVETISKLFKGKSVLGNEASERIFKQFAQNYGLIHLAMHGQPNMKNALLSSLIFSASSDTTEDNFLYAHEISHMKLNAALVVLSACETGYGKYEAGEGVMSIARSFMYAGVPSLVVSLWQVNDQSTSLIMESFYKHLNDGMNKANALQQAKLDYLNRTKGIAGHPSLWAPFIQLGDHSAIEMKTSSSWLTWVLGISGILGLGLIAKIFLGRSKEA